MAPPIVTFVEPPIGTSNPGVGIFVEMVGVTKDIDPATIQVSLVGPSGAINLVAGGLDVSPVGWAMDVAAQAPDFYEVSATTKPALEVGAWEIFVTVSDLTPETTNTSQPFTIAANAPVISGESPEGVATALNQIAFRLTDDWGIDTSTIEMSVIDSASRSGDSLTIISGGVVDSDWGGYIATSDGKVVDVRITEFPSVFTDSRPARIWTFSVDATSIVGVDL